MSIHPDADAFIRAILRDPAGAATRLVFADWLEETCEASNVAWAKYIRLMAEASEPPLGSIAQDNLDRRASEYAPAIRATLTINAEILVLHADYLWKLLPKPNLRVKLAGYEVCRAVIELIPESVARENDILPLQLDGNHLLIATVDPHNQFNFQNLEFILNKEIAPVRANAYEIRAAIQFHYGDREYYSVDTPPLTFPHVSPK